MPTTVAQSSPPYIRDEPDVEVLRGIEVPKAYGKRRHACLQGASAMLLNAWAADKGEVAISWRFWLSRGPDDQETTLVPDVAFVADERMRDLSDEDADEPPFAPSVAVEIRSPEDRERNIATKASLYLAAGASLVLDVDPSRRRITAHVASACSPSTTRLRMTPSRDSRSMWASSLRAGTCRADLDPLTATRHPIVAALCTGAVSCRHVDAVAAQRAGSPAGLLLVVCFL